MKSTLFNCLNNLRNKSKDSSKIQKLDQVLKRVTPLYIIFDGPLFSRLLIRDGEQMDVTLREMAH